MYTIISFYPVYFLINWFMGKMPKQRDQSFIIKQTFIINFSIFPIQTIIFHNFCHRADRRALNTSRHLTAKIIPRDSTSTTNRTIFSHHNNRGRERVSRRIDIYISPVRPFAYPAISSIGTFDLWQWRTYVHCATFCRNEALYSRPPRPSPIASFTITLFA